MASLAYVGAAWFQADASIMTVPLVTHTGTFPHARDAVASSATKIVTFADDAVFTNENCIVPLPAHPRGSFRVPATVCATAFALNWVSLPTATM